MTERRGWAAIVLLLAATGVLWAEGSPEATKSTGEEPLQISMYIHYWNTTSGGMYKDSWEVWQEIQRRTGTVITNVAPEANSDSWSAYNLTIASGDMPDLMTYERGVLNGTALEGAFVPLSDHMSKMPDYRKALAMHDRSEEFLKNSDGKIYTTAKFYAQSAIPDWGWLIRQDWLDSLGLEAPETISEFIEVARAFRDRDPNGNGKKDEIPIFAEESLTALLEIFGGSRQETVVDGIPVWGPSDISFRDAVDMLAGLYEEGLIDLEVFTRNTPQEPLLQQNLGGIFFGVVPSLPRLESTVPGIDLSYILPPEYNGRRMNHRTPRIVGDIATAVSVSAKERDRLLEFLDWFYTDEAGLLMNWGIQGRHYNMVNGRRQVSDMVLKDPERTPVGVLRDAGAYIEWGYLADTEHGKQLLLPALVRIAEKFSVDQIGFKPLFPNLPLTVEEKKANNAIRSDINSLSSEYLMKSVLGAMDPVESWQTFQGQLRNVGVETFNQNLKAAHARM